MRAKVCSQVALVIMNGQRSVSAQGPCQGRPGSLIIGVFGKTYDVNLGEARIDTDFFGRLGQNAGMLDVA